MGDTRPSARPRALDGSFPLLVAFTPPQPGSDTEKSGFTEARFRVTIALTVKQSLDVESVMKVVLAIALGLAAWSASARDIRTLDGRVFHNCQVSRVDPDGLCILYPGGGAKVKFSNLPESVRRAYGYDPRKAAAYERAQARARQRARARPARALRQRQFHAVARFTNIQKQVPPDLPRPALAERTRDEETSVRAPAAVAPEVARASRGSGAFAPTTLQNRLVNVGAEMVGVNLAPFRGAGYGGGYGGGYGAGGGFYGGYVPTGAQYVTVVLAPVRYGFGGYAGGGYRGGYGGRGY